MVDFSHERGSDWGSLRVSCPEKTLPESLLLTSTVVLAENDENSIGNLTE